MERGPGRTGERGPRVNTPWPGLQNIYIYVFVLWRPEKHEVSSFSDKSNYFFALGAPRGGQGSFFPTPEPSGDALGTSPRPPCIAHAFRDAVGTQNDASGHPFRSHLGSIFRTFPCRASLYFFARSALRFSRAFCFASSALVALRAHSAHANFDDPPMDSAVFATFVCAAAQRKTCQRRPDHGLKTQHFSTQKW